MISGTRAMRISSPKMSSISAGRTKNGTKPNPLSATRALVSLALLLVFLGASMALVGGQTAGRREGARAGAPLAASSARFRRHTSQQQQQQQQQQRQQQALHNSGELQTQESLFEQVDEQALRRQLPDLIAQAHNDKALERAFIRLLISASLRTGLNGMQSQATSQQQLGSSSGGSQASWQLDGGLDAGQTSGELVPVRSFGRLEQAELANLEAQLAAANELGLQQADQAGQQFGSAMDKREYIKPCSFNAISCVRTPFRRLK